MVGDWFMNDEKEKKQLKRYRQLGASEFQKVVLKVEEYKFKILKKCFPNFIRVFDKFCNWKQKKALKKATTEEEKIQIKENTKLAKMAMRKEWNQEKNRNYHMDPKKPTELMYYLEWNKSVHKKGLIKNGILIPICIAGIVFHIPGAIALLIIELISAGINFECINIQNYNLCRIKKIQPMLVRRENEALQQDIAEFGKAAEVIHESIEQSESLPTFEEILNNIDNIEQLKQMRALFQREIEDREMQKKRGEKK